MLDLVLEVWSLQPGRNILVLEAGRLQFEFGCTQGVPVPWAFLHAFTQHKVEAVRRGFAERVVREWWVETGGDGRVCYAGLSIVEKGFL